MFFFFQAEDGIRDYKVTGVQTCALPISDRRHHAGQLRCVSQPGEESLGDDPAAVARVEHRRAADDRRRLRAAARLLPHRLYALPRPRFEIGRAHSELQSPCNLVCRLLLEKKKKTKM